MAGLEHGSVRPMWYQTTRGRMGSRCRNLGLEQDLVQALDLVSWALAAQAGCLGQGLYRGAAQGRSTHRERRMSRRVKPPSVFVVLWPSAVGIVMALLLSLLFLSV